MANKIIIFSNVTESLKACVPKLTLIFIILSLPLLHKLSVCLCLPLSLTHTLSPLSLSLSLYMYICLSHFCMQFDYLIVFPLTEGVYTDPLYRKGGKEYGSRISWAEVAHTWSKGRKELNINDKNDMNNENVRGRFLKSFCVLLMLFVNTIHHGSGEYDSCGCKRSVWIICKSAS